MKLGAGIALALAALAASAVPAHAAVRRAGPGHPPAGCAVRLGGGARVRGRLRGAGAPALPLRRGDRQPGRHARPVPHSCGRWPGHLARRRPSAGQPAEPGDDPVRVRRPLRLRLELQLRLREDARALPLLLGGALLAAAGGRGGARVGQDRLLPVRLLRAEAGEPLRLQRARARRGDVVRVQRPAAGDRPHGALAGRRRHLQRAARAPVGRHHRPGAGPRGRPRPGQPAAVRAREQRGEQHHQRVAGDPGRAGGGRGGLGVGGALR